MKKRPDRAFVHDNPARADVLERNIQMILDVRNAEDARKTPQAARSGRSRG